MLEITGAGKAFNGKAVIASATLSLKAGEILCLTGPSGVGKTTLLEIAAGVTKLDSGTVESYVKAALMFQDDVLIPWLTAEEAITYILPASLPGREQKKHAAVLLGKFGLECGIYPAAMSGGMRRRLSIARTFAAGRRLILLDEPFAFLDDGYCRLIAEEMANHAEAGGGIVLASHTVAPLRLPVFSGIPLRIIEIKSSPVVIKA